jgi:hypothetical protein
MKYAKDVMAREAHPGILRMLKDALDVGPSGKKSFGGGLLSVELSVKPGTPPLVFRPFEEALQRAVVCPHCGLDHAVFGLAVWCSDCGQDIFMTHVEAEFSVIQTMLCDVERRRNELGSRVAARDIENCLEDTVSIYEAVLRALLVRSLYAREINDDEIHAVLKRIGNSFQNIRRSGETFQKELSIPLLDCVQSEKVASLIRTFEKRHPIAHNLGVVDRKYLERLRSAEREGREIRIMPEEISAAVRTVLEILTFAHKRLFLDENQQHK